MGWTVGWKVISASTGSSTTVCRWSVDHEIDEYFIRRRIEWLSGIYDYFYNNSTLDAPAVVIPVHRGWRWCTLTAPCIQWRRYLRKAASLFQTTLLLFLCLYRVSFLFSLSMPVCLKQWRDAFLWHEGWVEDFLISSWYKWSLESVLNLTNWRSWMLMKSNGDWMSNERRKIKWISKDWLAIYWQTCLELQRSRLDIKEWI